MTITPGGKTGLNPSPSTLPLSKQPIASAQEKEITAEKQIWLDRDKAIPEKERDAYRLGIEKIFHEASSTLLHLPGRISTAHQLSSNSAKSIVKMNLEAQRFFDQCLASKNAHQRTLQRMDDRHNRIANLNIDFGKSSATEPGWYEREMADEIRQGHLVMNAISLPFRAVGEGIRFVCEHSETANKLCQEIGKELNAIKTDIKKIPGATTAAAHLRTGIERLKQANEGYGVSRAETDRFLESTSIVSTAIATAGVAAVTAQATRSIGLLAKYPINSAAASQMASLSTSTLIKSNRLGNRNEESATTARNSASSNESEHSPVGAAVLALGLKGSSSKGVSTNASKTSLSKPSIKLPKRKNALGEFVKETDFSVKLKFNRTAVATLNQVTNVGYFENHTLQVIQRIKDIALSGNAKKLILSAWIDNPKLKNMFYKRYTFVKKELIRKDEYNAYVYHSFIIPLQGPGRSVPFREKLGFFKRVSVNERTDYLLSWPYINSKTVFAVVSSIFDSGNTGSSLRLLEEIKIRAKAVGADRLLIKSDFYGARNDRYARIAERRYPCFSGNEYQFSFEVPLVYLDKKIAAWKFYNSGLAKEQSLIERITFPAEPLKQFPPHLNKFYSECKLEPFHFTQLGSSGKGMLKGHLVYVQQGKEAFFSLQYSCTKSFDLGHNKFYKSKGIAWEERLEHTLKAIREFSEKKGFKKIYITWDPNRNPVGTVLEKHSQSFLPAGSISQGINQPKLPVISIELKNKI